MAHSADHGEVQTDALAGAFDEDGLLRPDAVQEPDAARRLLVFAQRPDARVELGAWQNNAEAFFKTRVGATIEKRYPRGFPRVDAVAMVVVPRDGSAPGTRLCYGRPRTDSELVVAEDADSRAGSAGLGLLARRCPSVWLVGRTGEEDRLALLLAAILASVVLGPILTPEGELFGVKTARAKLETIAGPYR